jgi:hypothetical protein
MSDNGDSSREPQVATSEGGETAAPTVAGVATTTSSRPGTGKVMRRSLPRSTRDTSWASGSGIEPAAAPPPDDPANVQAAATEGVATPGGPLPHREELEGAFGLDLSSIVAHTGPEAQKTSRAMGANAYATGHHVVLPQGADRGLVAHEVTHVLQQQQGVHQSGGVDGGASDPLEQQADAVGAAVERGESVAHQFASPVGGRAVAGAPVQRDSTKKGEAPKLTDAEKTDLLNRARTDRALAGISLLGKRWTEAIPELALQPGAPWEKLTVPKFKQAAYSLLVVDRIDASPVASVLEAPGREEYAKALQEAVQLIGQDQPHFAQIKECIKAIVEGGAVPRNRIRIVAHHALLSAFGKRAMRDVPLLGLDTLKPYYESGAAFNHAKVEDEKLGVSASTTVAGASTAKDEGRGVMNRPMAVNGLIQMFATTAPALEASGQGSGAAAPAAVDPDVESKALVLKAAIEEAIGKANKQAAKGTTRVLTAPDRALLEAALTAAGPKACDKVFEDTALMTRFNMALDAREAQEILKKLDPVERLYKICGELRILDEEPATNQAVANMTRHGRHSAEDVQKAYEHFKLKGDSGVFKEIRKYLVDRPGKAGAAQRLRLLEHTKLKDDFIDRLPDPDSKKIYRLIYRGNEDPSAEDKVHLAAEKKDGAALVTALRELASEDAARLKALEKDSVFRASALALTKPVVMPDGMRVVPSHLVLIMWGIDPGDHAGTDPGTAKLAEFDPSGQNTPLTQEERLTLDGQLFEPCLKELNDELTGKNMKEEYTTLGTGESAQKMRRTFYPGRIGDPQAVSNVLVNHDRIAAKPEMVALLRRERLVFGREIERRYLERYGVDLRTWIYQNSGPVNRSGANRVLGNEQGASVGMFNGKIMMAGEMDQKGKMTLAQALREHTWEDRPIYEWASVSSRAIASGIDDRNKKKILDEWEPFRVAVLKTTGEMSVATGIKVRAIDLLRNAYAEHSGHFQTNLEGKFHDKQDELREIKRELGLTEDVDVPPDAPPPTVAEQAEKMFGSPAKTLWWWISQLHPMSQAYEYTCVGTMMQFRKMPEVPADAASKAKPAPAKGEPGYSIEQRPPRNFNAYYQLQYGISPDRHAAAIVRGMPDDKRVVPAEEAGKLLNLDDPKMVTGEWKAPEGEDSAIGEHNRHLVRSSFVIDGTRNDARKAAEEIWKVLLEQSRFDVIQTTLGKYIEEEQRLIRVEFRKLSGGIDLAFYVRQAMEARERRKYELMDDSSSFGLSSLSTVPKQSTLQLASNRWAYASNIGTEGTQAGKAITTDRVIATAASDSELDQMLSISMSGNLDVRTRLWAAIKRDSQEEALRVVDELTVDERKIVLKDGPLMSKLVGSGWFPQFEEERVYKILTGQGDLADRLYSRSHGGTYWERKLWGGTDEEGMKRDIALYTRQMRLKANADVRAEAEAIMARNKGTNSLPIPPEVIEKEVDRRVGEAFMKLAANPSCRKIMESELTDSELAEMDSMIRTGSGTAHDWAVAGRAGKNDILADIQSMKPHERQMRLNDPNYMRVLGQQLRDEKDFREAVNALKEGSAGNGISKLDDASRTALQAEGSKPEKEKTLTALTTLSQAEFEALKGNPQLQAQVIRSLDEEGQKVFRQYLAGPDGNLQIAIETANRVPEDAWAGPEAARLKKNKAVLDARAPVKPAGKGEEPAPDPLKDQVDADTKLVADRKDKYVRHLVHHAIFRLAGECRTKSGWNLVLEAAVEVYKTDLPGPVDAKADKDKTSPRRVIWDEVKGAVKAFGAHHDATPFMMTKQKIDGAAMETIVREAVLGKTDPTDALVAAKIVTVEEQEAVENHNSILTSKERSLLRTGAGVLGLGFGTKDHTVQEDDMKEVVSNASDDHVIKAWSTYMAPPPGGNDGHTMKARYDSYRTAFDGAKEALKVRYAPPKKEPPKEPRKPPAPSVRAGAGADPTAGVDAAADQAKQEAHPTSPLGPLTYQDAGEWGGQKHESIRKMELERARFIEFKIGESSAFEALLRPFMGDHDTRGLTAKDSYDPGQPKMRVSKNKRYNNLIESLLQRVTTIDPRTVAAVLQMLPEDHWLLQTGMREETAHLQLAEQKNLRYSGLQREGGATAGKEKEQLDVSAFLYYNTFGKASADYQISGDEKENLSYRRSENERARDSYKTALETAAMWAALIVSVLLTVVATILTGGLALGPIGAMAIGGVTMLLSAKAQAAVTKDIMKEEFDTKDEADMVTKEVMTGLVTMGTTFFAQGILSVAGKGMRLAGQAAGIKQVLGKPPSLWQVFLREASEEVTSEVADTYVSAELEAAKPEHWVDGFKQGAKKSAAAADAIRARASENAFTGAVTSIVTAGVGKWKNKNRPMDKPEFEVPGAGRKRQVNLRKNLKQAFGDPEEKFTAAGLEWLMEQAKNGSIDWDKAPEDLLKGLLQEYKEIGHEAHINSANRGMRSRKVDRHFARHGHMLTGKHETAIYEGLTKHADDAQPFLTVKDFVRIRTEVAVAGLQAYEMEHGELSPPQRDAFVNWVRDAESNDAVHERARRDPLTVLEVRQANAKAGPNTQVGTPIADEATAVRVMRDLADGNKTTLHLIGILDVPDGFDSTKNEWGLGKRTDPASGKVSYIIIKGEEGAVDWSGFPGIVPVAHSHPDLGPDGRRSNHLKKVDAQGGVEVSALCSTDGPDRIHFMPSGADLVFLLHHNLKEHTVYTAFQSLGGTRVGNPTPGSNNAGINIVIRNPTLHGNLFGLPGSPIVQVEIEIFAGNQRIHTMKLWGSDHMGGSHLWHRPPGADMMRGPDHEAGGEQGNQANARPGQRRTPSGRRDQDHQGPTLLHPDPNHASNRPTQQITAVTPEPDSDAPQNRPTQVIQTPSHPSQRTTQVIQTPQAPTVTPQQGPITPHLRQPTAQDRANQAWRNDQTSPADLKKQVDPEEWEIALGHIKEARLDPEVGPTIAHIPDHELVALFLYTDYHYRRWNLALRENDSEKLQEYAGKIKAADSALAALPSHEGWVERGTGILDDAVLAQYQPGKIVTEQAFTSASAGQGNQGGFTGGATVFRIKSKTGKRIDKLAKRGENETEVLFRPGTRFVVTERTQHDHTTVITMEEVEDDSQSTRSGSTGSASPQGGMVENDFRTNQASARQNARAQARIDRMSDTDRTRFSLIHSMAENQTARMMLERALAAGHSLDEIHTLRMAMDDMSEQDILKYFTGAGIVQLYEESCVPSAYQIAIADADPLFAMQLRNNPSMMMQQQRDALAVAGGRQVPRNERRRGNMTPRALRDHMADPLAQQAAQDQSNYNAQGGEGIETTQMAGGPMHQQLEQATGARYDVITNDAYNYGTPGQGQFPAAAVPHPGIRAALDANMPVIISTRYGGGGPHAIVLLGRTVDANGVESWIHSDPMYGATMALPVSLFDQWGILSVTMPRAGDTVAPGGRRQQQGPGAGGGVRTGSTGGEEPQKVAEVLTQLKSAPDEQKPALAAKIRELVPPGVADLWLAANHQHFKGPGELNQLLEVLNPTKPRASVAEDDSWTRSDKQAESLEQVKTGSSDKAHKDRLVDELNRQVPDLALTTAVQRGDAEGREVKSVVTLVAPGGPISMKKLNDDLIGPDMTDKHIMPARNAIIKAAFARQKLTVVEQTFKETTIVSPHDASSPETEKAIKQALDEIDREMQNVLRLAMKEGIEYWQARADNGDQDAAKRVKNIQQLMIWLSKGNWRFEARVGVAEMKGGADTSYDQVLAAKMNAVRAARMGVDAEGGARARVYSEEDFLKTVKTAAQLREKLSKATLTIDGARVPVFDGDRIQRDILRDLRKGKLKVIKGEEEILTDLKAYFDLVNTLDYIKHHQGADIQNTSQRIRDAQDLASKLNADGAIEGADAEKISKILEGDRAQKDTASEAQFFHKSAQKGDRLILSADMKDLGLEVFDDYAMAMADIHDKKLRGDALSRRAGGADRGVLNRKRDALEVFKIGYERIRQRAITVATFTHNEEALAALKAEDKPPILLGGDEITVSLHPIFDQLGLVSDVVKILTEDPQVNARVAIARSGVSNDQAAAQQNAMKEGSEAHGDLKDLEQRARDLAEVVEYLPFFMADDRMDADRHLATLQGAFISVENGADGSFVRVVRTTARSGPDGKPEVVPVAQVKREVDELIEWGRREQRD